MLRFRASSALVVAFALFAALGVGQADEDDLCRLEKIEIGKADKEVLVHIKGTKTPDFTTFTLKDPFRLVLDWAGSRVAGAPARQSFEGLVRKITAKQHDSESDQISRVTIELAKETDYRLETKGSAVIVRFKQVALPAPKPKKKAPPADGKKAKPLVLPPAPPSAAGPATERAAPVPEGPKVSLVNASKDAGKAKPIAANAAPSQEDLARRQREAFVKKAIKEEAERKDHEARAKAEAEARAKAEEARRQREEQARIEAKRAEEAAARAKALEEQRRREAEAKAKAAEEQRRREAELKAKALEEQRRREAEAKAKAAEEQRRREEALKAKALEEQRRREAEAKSKALEKQRRREEEAKAKAAEDQRRREADAQAKALREQSRREAEAKALEARRAAEEQAQAEKKRLAAEAFAKAEADRHRIEGEREQARRAREEQQQRAEADRRAREEANRARSERSRPKVPGLPVVRLERKSKPSRDDGIQPFPIFGKGRIATVQDKPKPKEKSWDYEDEPKWESEPADKKETAGFGQDVPDVIESKDGFDPGTRRMTYIGFSQQPKKSAVFVKIDGKARYKLMKEEGNKVILLLIDTVVELENNTRQLDTRFFDSPVVNIQAHPGQADVRVEIDLRKMVGYEIKRIGRQIWVYFNR